MVSMNKQKAKLFIKELQEVLYKYAATITADRKGAAVVMTVDFNEFYSQYMDIGEWIDSDGYDLEES